MAVAGFSSRGEAYTNTSCRVDTLGDGGGAGEVKGVNGWALH
jgi:hypothetical protein